MAAPTLVGTSEHAFSDTRARLDTLADLAQQGEEIRDPDSKLARRLAQSARSLGVVHAPEGHAFVVTAGRLRLSGLAAAESDGDRVACTWVPMDSRIEGMLAGLALHLDADPVAGLSSLNTCQMKLARAAMGIIDATGQTVGVRAHPDCVDIRRVRIVPLTDLADMPGLNEFSEPID